MGCFLAWVHPPTLLWFHPWISYGLGAIMLGMGLTLRVEDFSAVLKQPSRIAVGVFLQFFIMPCSAVVCAKVFQLPADLALGLILVGCCPGGTASNVICYLARANVALSVLLTMCSTFAAILMTPLLCKFLAGHLLQIDAWQMFLSMLQLVLLPLFMGIWINHLVEKSPHRKAISASIGVIGPLASVIVIVLVVASIIAKSKPVMLQASASLVPAVVLMHVLGFLLGYIAARLIREKEDVCRTISVEVGMQNSGLGATLATKHFPQIALAPVPAAISAVVHSLIGSLLAWYWNRSNSKRD
jgi:BASS family bile acid:Na+ symporter